MVRFWDITLLLVCITLSISMVNSLGIFTTNYMEVPDNPAFNMSDVRSQVGANTGTSVQTDYFSSIIGFATIALGFIFTFITTTFWSYGVMVDMFHMPPVLAAAIEALMIYSLMSFIIQVYMKFGWKQIES